MPGESSQMDGSPGIGIRRAMILGGLAAAVFILISIPLAWYFPILLQAAILRAFFALLAAWVLFGVAQRAAGMAGWPVTIVVLVLSLLVLISHHVVGFAHGVLNTKGWYSLALLSRLAESEPANGPDNEPPVTTISFRLCKHRSK